MIIYNVAFVYIHVHVDGCLYTRDKDIHVRPHNGLLDTEPVLCGLYFRCLLLILQVGDTRNRRLTLCIVCLWHFNQHNQILKWGPFYRVLYFINLHWPYAGVRASVTHVQALLYFRSGSVIMDFQLIINVPVNQSQALTEQLAILAAWGLANNSTFNIDRIWITDYDVIGRYMYLNSLPRFILSPIKVRIRQ